jgi:hypothetical protein
MRRYNWRFGHATLGGSTRALAGWLGTAFVSIVFLAGCATFGSYETAQTTARGKFGYGVAITPLHVSRDSEGVRPSILPLPELSGRLGVTGNFELGARWGFGPGMTLTGKYLFSHSPVDAAVVAYGSLYGITAGATSLWIYDFSPRVIVSQEVAGAFQYSTNVGLDFAGVAVGVGNESASGNSISLVAGLGLPFRFGEQRDIRFMPELSLSFPVVSSYRAEGTGSVQNLIGSLAANLGVGFAYVP